MAKFKGFSGKKTIGGETFKFKNGITTLGTLKFTLKEILDSAKEVDEEGNIIDIADVNEKDFPKSEGW